MNTFSRKEYLSLKMPTEEVPVSDQKRIELALQALGYTHVSMPLRVLRKLYPMCRNADFEITVSLVQREADWVITDIEPGDCRQHHYGLAVDYGSTTIVMQLVDLNSGSVIAEEKQGNGQAQYGADILSRITYALEDPTHMEALRKATAETFHQLMKALTAATGIEAAKCPAMIVSGNTTMIHFLLGLDAWTVFAAPYAPVTTAPGFLWGEEVGIDFPGILYVIPAASNYIGGDIVSGLLKLDIHKQNEISMFFDIGTNGELVLGNQAWMIAGAGAAGPALEGYISRYGMRAMPGAIDKVWISGKTMNYTTIENQKPIGICGSGIIDLLSQMRIHGWMDMAGYLNPQASDRIIYLPEEKQYAVVYAHAEDTECGMALYFTQTDIAQYLDTKAAAFTMIECILEAAGVAEHDIQTCYLSGAFPAHSDLEAAITIGIFPDLSREKYQVIANTSVEGARILLMHRDRLQELEALAENMYCVQFASIPDFLIRMQAAKFIPHTDMERFPHIKQKLSAADRK